MSERDGFEPGVPCWVDTWQPDPNAAVGFYTQLFGWDAEETGRADSSDSYFICRLRGREVAAVGGPPRGARDSAPAWRTHFWVESADNAAAEAAAAGGRVVTEPFDALDGGRIAVVADPAGAVFGLWQSGAHKGAQLVNEAGAWSWSQLNARDPDGSKVFYRALFGWETDAFGELTMWRVPGFVGGEPGQPVPRDVVAGMEPMGEAELQAGTPSHWSIDFWVEDADATAAKAAELGGKVVAPAFDTPVSRTAVVADPQGARFSVSTVPGAVA